MTLRHTTPYNVHIVFNSNYQKFVCNFSVLFENATVGLFINYAYNVKKVITILLLECFNALSFDLQKQMKRILMNINENNSKLPYFLLII